MGSGGRMSQNTPSMKKDHVLERVPVAKPSFTLSQLKKAIPPHCFKRSILRSMSYVVSDLTISSILYYLATTYIPLIPSPLLRYLLAWPIYWVLQGAVLMGIWVLGHECGHHAFSDYSWLDDTMGLILHSSILYPYFSWKYSHRRHHANTGNLERDELFVPKLKSEVPWYSKYVNNPLGRFISLAIFFALALPLYLIFNQSGRKYDRFASHFDPYSPIYSERERFQVLVSDVGVFAVLYVLFKAMAVHGVGWVVCVYGVPQLMMGGFLVVVSYLNHTHQSLPHYDSEEWDWLRGALTTVDRDYGVFNKAFHHATDSHVVHHLFPMIPHYHGIEATNALRPILGNYYNFDATPAYKALWRELKECIYVEPDEGSQDKGVLWYRNK
ncbi:hypothetical protein AAC387_Pa12g0002 [Persea americana]